MMGSPVFVRERLPGSSHQSPFFGVLAAGESVNYRSTGGLA